MNYCLERDFKAWNQTPYWIFRLPTAVVPDHSEIFTDRFTDFLSAFLPPLGDVGTAPKSVHPTPKTEAGVRRIALPPVVRDALIALRLRSDFSSMSIRCSRRFGDAARASKRVAARL